MDFVVYESSHLWSVALEMGRGAHFTMGNYPGVRKRKSINENFIIINNNTGN